MSNVVYGLKNSHILFGSLGVYWYNIKMSKVKIIFGLGIWVAILPYLGFPYSLKNILFSITGLGIIYFCYLLYRDLKVGETEKKLLTIFLKIVILMKMK